MTPDEPTDPRQSLAAAVVAQRVSLGYDTRQKLADASNLSLRTIGDIERGVRVKFDGSTVAKLERALRWPVGTFTTILNGGVAGPAAAAPAAGERVIVDGRPGREAYGSHYWIVNRPGGGYISVYADRVALDGGHLTFYGCTPETLTLALAPGQWTAFYAAALIDGSPVAVDRWVERDPA